MELPCICEKEYQDFWLDNVSVYIKLASSMKDAAFYFTLLKNIVLSF